MSVVKINKTGLKKLRVVLLMSCLTFGGFSQLNAQSTKMFQASIDDSLSIANEELEYVFKRILKEYATDTAFIAATLSNQAIWFNFIDSEIKMRFAGLHDSAECVKPYQKELILNRIIYLKQWLSRKNDCDCEGSQAGKPPKIR